MALSTLEMQALNRTGGAAETATGDALEQGMTWYQGLVALALGVYLLACGLFALWFMAHIWGGSLELLKPLFPHLEFKSNLEPAHFQDILTFINTIGGAVLGAVILCFQGLHKHAVVTRCFRVRFSGSYLIGPWAAGLLGVAAYAMLRGGLLLFGTDEVGSDGVACYAFLSAGIMTGFAWERMLARIDDAARQLFGSRKPAAAAVS